MTLTVIQRNLIDGKEILILEKTGIFKETLVSWHGLGLTTKVKYDLQKHGKSKVYDDAVDYVMIYELK